MILVARARESLRKYTHLDWVYLGSTQNLPKVEKKLDLLKRRFIGKDLQRISDALRNNFIEYIGRLSCCQSDAVLWFSSRMASKSISQTPIFHHYIYLKLIAYLYETVEENILWVSDDEEFLRHIRTLKPPGVILVSSKPFIFQLVRQYLQGFSLILRYGVGITLFKFLRHPKLTDFNVFIHSWVDIRVFDQPGVFTDAYFAQLETFLRNKQCSVARLLPLQVCLHLAFALRRRFKNLVFPLSYLTFKDFFRGILTKFSVTDNLRDIAGIDDLKLLQGLLRYEIAKENRQRGYLSYLFSFFAYMRISRDLPAAARIIYPFENQPWEKMLLLAMPQIPKIAYLHSTIPYNWLDYYRIGRETQRVVPEVILTPGKIWSGFLSKYYKNSKISEAGALRYTHLFQKKPRPVVNSRQGYNIVAALAISADISRSLQLLLLQFIKTHPDLKISLKIKTHPYLPQNANLQKLFVGHENCRYVDTAIDQLLKQADVLVTSGSSSAFEAVCSGIKTICFVPEGISLGVEQFLGKNVFIAYEEDFSSVLLQALKNPDSPRADISEFFSPADYNVFWKYLQAPKAD